MTGRTLSLDFEILADFLFGTFRLCFHFYLNSKLYLCKSEISYHQKKGAWLTGHPIAARRNVKTGEEMGAAPVTMRRTFPPRLSCLIDTKDVLKTIPFASVSCVAKWVEQPTYPVLS